METKLINDTKYLIHDKEGKDQIDTIALRMMEQNEIAGLLPFKYVQQGRKKYFRYEMGTDETLEEWLSRAQSRKDVTKLLASLIFVSSEAEAYLLEPEHICTDIPFIAVRDNKCEAAYIPLKEGTHGNILQLAQKIVTLVKYALDEDFSYLFDLQNAFGRGDIQNLTDLKKWLRIVNGEEKAPVRSSEPFPGEEVTPKSGGGSLGMINHSPLSDPVPGEAAAQPSPEAGTRSDSFEGIFGESGLVKEKKTDRKQDRKREKKQDKKTDEKHGFLFKSKRKNKNENDTEEEAAVSQEEAVQKQALSRREIINDLDRGDSTVMMTTGPQTVLVKVRNGMEHILSGDSYVVGSGPQADIVVTDNRTVSRKHARIFISNGSYYIEDLGSTNGTCVNGEMLRKMEPYKLDDRARIRFSDEDYFFEIRG